MANLDKDKLQQIDDVFEQAIAELKVLIEGLKASAGNQVDCLALSAYGDLVLAAHKVNRAKEMLNQEDSK